MMGITQWRLLWGILVASIRVARTQPQGIVGILLYRRSTMTTEQALAHLAELRSAFVAVRKSVEEELRMQRAKRLFAYTKDIEKAVLEAYASGATLGAIKRAYGTSDHRTVATIVENGLAEIEAMRLAKIAADEERAANTEWFTFLPDRQVEINWAGDSAVFEIADMEDDDIILTTKTPRWNDDFTVENRAVAQFDGYTSDEVTQIELIRTTELAQAE